MKSVIVMLALFAISILATSLSYAQDPATPVPPCQCRAWKGDSAKIVGMAQSVKVKCNSSVTIKVGAHLITPPTFVCYPLLCQPQYNWTIVNPSGTPTNYSGPTWLFNFSAVGTYLVTITPKCGTQKCPPCIFKVVVV